MACCLREHLYTINFSKSYFQLIFYGMSFQKKNTQTEV